MNHSRQGIGGDHGLVLRLGLAPSIPEVDCQGQALAEVTVTSHFGYDPLSVVTLGLVSPKKIEWKCAGATPDEGTIPTGSPAPSAH